MGGPGKNDTDRRGVFWRTRELKPGSTSTTAAEAGVRRRHATLPFLPLYGPVIWEMVGRMNFEEKERGQLFELTP